MKITRRADVLQKPKSRHLLSSMYRAPPAVVHAEACTLFHLQNLEVHLAHGRYLLSIRYYYGV